MELLQLKYFQKIARLEHMTKAAQELSIAQPALSKSLQLLEKELEVKLFDRIGKNIKLNQYGKAFLKKVDTALAILDDGKRELSSMGKTNHEHIYLAFLAASPLLPELLSSFGEKYPNTDFHLLQHLTKYSSYDFDLCISSLPLNIDNVINIPVMTESIFLAVPNNHPLAHRESIKLSEVSNESFIHLKPGNALREITDNFCKISGFIPHIIFESDDPATVRGLIKAGQGVGFIPAISWGGTTGPAVTLLKIEEPICERTIVLSWGVNRYQSQAVKMFQQFTIDYFKNLSNK